MPFFVLTPQLQAAIEANARAEAAEDWLDIMTAASEFHVPTGRIIAEYRIGRLPFKIVGRRYLFRRSDLAHFIEQAPSGDHARRCNPAKKR